MVPWARTHERRTHVHTRTDVRVHSHEYTEGSIHVLYTDMSVWIHVDTHIYEGTPIKNMLRHKHTVTYTYPFVIVDTCTLTLKHTYV